MTIDEARAAYEAAKAADRAGRTVTTMQAVKDAWAAMEAIAPRQKARPHWGSRAGRMRAKLCEEERRRLLTLTWGRDAR